MKIQPAHTPAKLWMIASIILFILSGALVLKYVRLKFSWSSYANQALTSIDEMRNKNSIEDAQIMATIVSQFPTGSPFLRQSTELQKLVTSISKQTKRDLVVVDSSSVILADTVPANVGKKFAEAKNKEVEQTLKDGISRNFTEYSVDYPTGIAQSVVPVKDASGKTVGAVIFSVSLTLK
jgi:regulator of extracellular matrix RemA (YlzA/DUF370 family)